MGIAAILFKMSPIRFALVLALLVAGGGLLSMSGCERSSDAPCFDCGPCNPGIALCPCDQGSCFNGLVCQDGRCELEDSAVGGTGGVSLNVGSDGGAVERGAGGESGARATGAP